MAGLFILWATLVPAAEPLTAMPPSSDVARLDAHVARGDCAGAMALIKVVEARAPTGALRYHAGLARIACGDLESGRAVLEALALAEPFDKAGKDAAATVMRLNDRVSTAADREALSAVLRAWFCVFAKEPARARDLVLAARAGGHTGAFADTYCLVLAQAYEALGEKAKAHREYERLVLEHPDSPYYSAAQFKVVGPIR